MGHRAPGEDYPTGHSRGDLDVRPGALQTDLRLVWLPALVLLVGGLISVSLWLLLRAQQETVIEFALEDEALLVASDIRAGSLQRSAVLARMAQRVTATETIDSSTWEIEANLLLSALPALEVLVWVGADEVLFWSTEYGTTTPPLSSLPEGLLDAMADARSSGMEQHVRASLNGRGVEAVVIPMQQDGEWSHLLGLSRMPDLLEELISPGLQERYSIVVQDELGRSFTYGASPTVAGVRSPEVPVRRGEVVWMVSVAPAGFRWRQMRTFVPELTLVFGLAAAALLSLATFSFGLARRRAATAESRGHELTREIEERRKTEVRLRESQHELEELTVRLRRSNEDLERFGSVVAHDLKEPVVTIGMYVEEVAREVEGGHGVSPAYLERMLVNVAGMARLIDDVLAYSRLATTELEYERVDLGRIARSVAEELTAVLEKLDARVDIDDLPVIEADPRQMSQLFRNLLGNSIKFRRETAPPRIVVFAKRAEPAGTSEPGQAADARVWWRISVSDNGVGFSQEDATRLFKEFSRLPSARHVEGTGLGLAICRRIVERHRGSISARPNPDVGSTMEILVPETQSEVVISSHQ